MAPGLLSHLHSYSSKSCSSAAGSSASPTFGDGSSPGYPREQLSSQQPRLWMGHDQQQLQRAAIFSCETRTVFQQVAKSKGLPLSVFLRWGMCSPQPTLLAPVSRAAQLCHPRNNQDKNPYLSQPSFIKVSVFLLTLPAAVSTGLL